MNSATSSSVLESLPDLKVTGSGAASPLLPLHKGQQWDACSSATRRCDKRSDGWRCQSAWTGPPGSCAGGSLLPSHRDSWPQCLPLALQLLLLEKTSDDPFRGRPSGTSVHSALCWFQLRLADVRQSKTGAFRPDGRYQRRFLCPKSSSCVCVCVFTV